MNLSKNYSNAMALVAKVGGEVGALSVLIKAQLEDLEIDGIREISENEEDVGFDSSYSACYWWKKVLDVKRKDDKKNFGQLYYYFDFYSENGSDVAKKIPLLNVGYADEGLLDPAEEPWVLPKKFGKGDLNDFLIEDKLICSSSDRKDLADLKSASWEFWLPLFSIGSLEDIKEQIITPIENIFKNNSGSIFPKKSVALEFKEVIEGKKEHLVVQYEHLLDEL